jgi:hypothetical protein
MHAPMRYAQPVEDSALIDTVLVDTDFFGAFLDDAITQYRKGRDSVSVHLDGGPLHRPNSFGLLGGTFEDDVMVVKRCAFASNVRAVDPVPLKEFKDKIVPQFGKQYDDGERGFWCSSQDLLRVSREFEAEGLEMLGSIHLHPDWHRIGPPHERGTQKLSEQPSRMDEYLFRNAGWPLNIICYLESRADGITHTYGAFRPPAHPESSAGVTQMAIRYF